MILEMSSNVVFIGEIVKGFFFIVKRLYFCGADVFLQLVIFFFSVCDYLSINVYGTTAHMIGILSGGRRDPQLTSND